MSKLKVGDRVRYVEHITIEDKDDYVIEQDYTISIIEDEKCYVEEVPSGNYLVEDQLELVEEPATFPTCREDITGEPKKYNDNKPMMSLIRPEFTKGLADVLTFGFKKYQEKVGESSNYLKGDGMYYTDIYDSLQRHLTSWVSGDSIDEESGKNHLLHAAANIMFLYTYEVTKKGKDNRETLYGKHNKS